MLGRVALPHASAGRVLIVLRGRSLAYNRCHEIGRVGAAIASSNNHDRYDRGYYDRGDRYDRGYRDHGYNGYYDDRYNRGYGYQNYYPRERTVIIRRGHGGYGGHRHRHYRHCGHYGW